MNGSKATPPSPFRVAWKGAAAAAHAARRLIPEANLDERDPGFVRRALAWEPFFRAYFRSEVRGLSNIPAEGPALLVANHSGGIWMPDSYLLIGAFTRHFGAKRPFYGLAHDWVMVWLGLPGVGTLRRFGTLAANPENARKALRAGAAVLLYPGGDYDVWRPVTEANTIDFDGRQGFLRTAYEENVPLVPVVNVGSHEIALFLGRGTRLAQLLRLDRKPFRISVLPIFVPPPFGIPLPAKITQQVLPPINLRERYPTPDGAKPDYDRMYDDVVATMQAALDRLAAERRFPVIG